jgi:hypothetical protein
MTAEERLCTDNYSVSGTFTLGESSPDNVNNETGEAPGDGMPDIQGCWPAGTWTFSLTRIDGDCGTVAVPPSFSFEVDFIADPIEPDFMETLIAPAVGSASAADYRLHVSQGGGGLCEGGLEIFSTDGKEVFNIHPTLNVFNTSGPLEGSGEFSRFSKNQVPETN